MVQIDFSVVFDKVHHQGITYKLCSVGIGGFVLSILSQFLLSRSQNFMVDGVCSKLFNGVPGVPQGTGLGPLLLPLYTLELFTTL